MNAELAIQGAIYTLLTGSPGVGYDVYDDIQNESYPYIVIGEATATDFDSKSFDGFEMNVVIHSWSRYSGRKEIKEMQGAIYNLLHNTELSVTGYNTVLCQFDFSESFMEDDSVTRHGVSRFRLIITEE